MKLVIHPNYQLIKDSILNVVRSFDTTGFLLTKGSRNTIKIYETETVLLNVKSFKKPNILNQLVYKYFRDSKAKRSYTFGLKLIDKGIGTPQPIAFVENSGGLGLGTSYYVCEHINAKYTYRDLVENPYLENHEFILRAFTQFCFKMHEAGVEFTDHSPGNTLIDVSDSSVNFYLVDLNRMNFHESMSFEMRMYNLRRLTPKKEMIAVMANEYSKLYKEQSEDVIFEELWKQTSNFQEKFFRKQRLKKKYKFWKK